MKRGDLVTVTLPRGLGKSRPALVLQSDLFDALPSVVVLPVTSEVRNAPLFRIRLQPDPGNRLRAASDVMVDKIQSVGREKVGRVIGSIDDRSMRAVDRALLVFLGIA